MGFYLEVGTNTRKAAEIIKQGGCPISEPWDLHDVPGDDWLVCVVDNGYFEAAGICFDEGERRDFTSPTDLRPKQWLLVPKELCAKLCPNYRDLVGVIERRAANA